MTPCCPSVFKGLSLPLFVGVAFLAAVGFLLVSVPESEPVERGGVGAGNVSVVRLDEQSGNLVLRQEAQLRDPAPLFLPTPWNNAQAVHAERLLLRPGDNFSSFQPQLFFEGGKDPVTLPAPVLLPSSPAASFSPLDSDRPFTGLAPREEPDLKIPPRAACIELRRSADGVPVLSYNIDKLNLEAASLWSPAEFMACVSSTGLVGTPALLAGSGVERVDQVLEETLVSNWSRLEMKGRLEPGLYYIRFGP